MNNFYIGLTVVLVLILIWFLRIIGNYLGNLIRLKETQMYINYKPEQDILKELDQLITDTFNTYILLNLAYKDKDYIDTTVEKEILYAIKDAVKKRISVAMMSRLALHYNKNIIGEIISEKINIIVIDYVVSNNKVSE